MCALLAPTGRPEDPNRIHVASLAPLAADRSTGRSRTLEHGLMFVRARVPYTSVESIRIMMFHFLASAGW